MVGAGAAGYLLMRNIASTVTTEDVPRLMREHVPCEECKVTNLSMHGQFFSVSIQSEEDPQRTLVYRVYESRSELAFSQDWAGSTPAWFDYKKVDWSLANELEADMNKRSIRGTGDVSVVPCDYGRKDGPVRACMQMTVLTKQGDLTRKIDAATGKEEPK